MLKLVNERCVNSTKYLFKVDDDMFVNMPRLMDTLNARKSGKEVLMGNLMCGAKPIKDSSNKWYAPKYMYPEKVYPNYLSGTGYVMSVDVAVILYETALKTPLFHLEDVYITGKHIYSNGKINSTNNAVFVTFPFGQIDNWMCDNSGSL